MKIDHFISRAARRLTLKTTSLTFGPRRATALIEAARKGDVRQVKILSLFGGLKRRDENGFTALMMAAWEGHADCVRALVARSDVNAISNCGRSALQMACLYGHAECAKLLLGGGAVASRPHHQRDALMDAAWSGSQACVDLVLPLCDTAARDAQGRGAVDMAGNGTVVGQTLAGAARARAETKVLGIVVRAVPAHSAKSRRERAFGQAL
jgi:hypothetical protein